jgi:hypothetical protein
MSEQTNGGSHIWTDPTAPAPTPSFHEMPSASVHDSPPVRPAPLAPPGPAYTYGQRPAAPHVPAPAAPPQNNPYAQQQPVPQYGQEYGPPPVHQYGQPQVQQYGQPPAPAYGQPYGTGAPSQTNASAIVLTILSVLSICLVVPIASLVLGIIALTKNSTDPEGSRRMTKIGWIVFGVGWGLWLLLQILSLMLNLS